MFSCANMIAYDLPANVEFLRDDQDDDNSKNLVENFSRIKA